MMTYLKDGACSLSNNLSEKSIRPLVVGRKNWLFSDTPAGAEASMNVYSMIETAKANNLRIRPYLQEVITYMRGHTNAKGSERIDVDPILPWSDEMQRRFSLSNPAEEGGIPGHVYVSAVNCSSSPDPIELR